MMSKPSIRKIFSRGPEREQKFLEQLFSLDFAVTTPAPPAQSRALQLPGPATAQPAALFLSDLGHAWVQRQQRRLPGHRPSCHQSSTPSCTVPSLPHTFAFSSVQPCAGSLLPSRKAAFTFEFWAAEPEGWVLRTSSSGQSPGKCMLSQFLQVSHRTQRIFSLTGRTHSS